MYMGFTTAGVGHYCVGGGGGGGGGEEEHTNSMGKCRNSLKTLINSL